MAQHFNTQAVHAGEARRKPYGALTTPIVQTSTYTFSDTAEIMDFMRGKEAEEPDLHDEYGRYSNPTADALPRTSWPSRGRPARLLFSSGMSAITTTLLALLSSGDHIVMVSDSYHRTREFAMMYLDRWGIRTTLVPIDEPQALDAAITPQHAPDLLRNPHQPLPARHGPGVHGRRWPKSHNLFTIVDSTFATPCQLCGPWRLASTW